MPVVGKVVQQVSLQELAWWLSNVNFVISSGIECSWDERKKFVTIPVMTGMCSMAITWCGPSGGSTLLT